MIHVQIDAPDINDIKARLGEFSRRAYVVMPRAVNRTVSHAKTVMGEQAARRYLISKTAVRKSLTATRATGKSPTAVIMSKGSPIPLTSFEIDPRKQMKRRKRKWKGELYNPSIYRARVLRGGSYIGVRRMFYVNGHVLQRPEGATKEENRNIKDWLRLTLSVPQMIKSPTVYDEIRDSSMKKLRKRVDHEIKYELERLKK